MPSLPGSAGADSPARTPPARWATRRHERKLNAPGDAEKRQVEHLYGGREGARTVLSNAKVRLLPGVGDLDTLRYWSELLGRTRTTTGGETYAEGHRTHFRNEHVDDLAPLRLLQQLPVGQAVLVYENLPPTPIRLLPWFKTRRFRHLREAT